MAKDYALSIIQAMHINPLDRNQQGAKEESFSFAGNPLPFS
jgi:hypothetical protein